jgi:hypothetical protein
MGWKIFSRKSSSSSSSGSSSGSTTTKSDGGTDAPTVQKSSTLEKVGTVAQVAALPLGFIAAGVGLDNLELPDFGIPGSGRRRPCKRGRCPGPKNSNRRRPRSFWSSSPC